MGLAAGRLEKRLPKALGGASKAAAFCAGLAISHWFLDLLTHRPDLPALP